MLDSQLFHLQGNADFVLNSLHWLSGEEDNITIRPKEKTVEPITLTPGQADGIFLATVVRATGRHLDQRRHCVVEEAKNVKKFTPDSARHRRFCRLVCLGQGERNGR